MKTLVYIQILLKLPVQHVQNDHVSELRGIAPSLDTKSVNDIKEYFLTEKAEFSHQNYRSLRTNHSFFQRVFVLRLNPAAMDRDAHSRRAISTSSVERSQASMLTPMYVRTRNCLSKYWSLTVFCAA